MRGACPLFQLEDMITFFWAFFFVLPIVAFIHQLGHFVFVWLFGGKAFFTLGRGKLLLRVGKLQINQYYFLDSFCQYERLKWDSKWTHVLVYAGGSIFNLASIIIVNSMIHAGLLNPHIFFYQFVYFSVYFVFFSLLPFKYSETHSSDGRSIYDVVKYGSSCSQFD